MDFVVQKASQHPSEMTDELRGAVVGAVVAELISAILKAKAVSVSGFGAHLDKLKCTLESLFPRVWEVQQLDQELTDNSQNGMLTSSRRKDMHELLQQLNNGKELIDECSKLPYWSFWKRHTCCKRLKELDKQLLRFVQMNIHADIWVDTKKLLQNTKDLHKKLDNQHGGLIGVSNINTNDFSCIDADLLSVCFDPGLTSEELSRHEVLLNCMTEAHDLEGVSFKRSGIEEAEESISKRAKLAGADLTTTITIRKEVQSELEMHLKQKDDTLTLLTIENSQLLNFIANSHSKTQMHLTCSHENTSTSRARQTSRFSSAKCKEKRIVIQDLIEFAMKELVVATNGFNGSQLIGKGGFGEVYKGKLRFTDVAIKRLVFGSTQGMPEFQKEVYILSRMRHPHIVTLLGACFKPVCLVYEFLSNGSLENRLSGSIGRAHLSWKIRIQITAQICSALGFLHSSSVVHGDLKPANILLDNNFWAKLSDFGMSHFFTSELERTSSIRGTMGYIDPDYVSTSMLTFKSDVYAYGLIILRLLTGKGVLGITEEVRRALSAGSLDQILDREAGDWLLHEAIGLAELGLHCCDVHGYRRPSMEEVWTKVQSYL